ncbi:hypothetical protein Taro_024020 [Colocasia esculenta]|uniref:Potassium transporter n=1 Tax=Colocasia esculenta TaxID=4460 RepID=A0A843V841_COLES|nr:hypothetical protein [Colocasia esculenta]
MLGLVCLALQDGWIRTLHLAFQSIGIIYGDIGTSPLYVFSSTFTQGIDHNEDILGVLSLILYTLILIPAIKYVFIVLWANDNGDGGTFALYSLISRYAKVSLVPNQQAEDMMLSNYKLETPSRNMKIAGWIKEKLETSNAAKTILFLVTILGTSMVLGDGVLTPCISGKDITKWKEKEGSNNGPTVFAVLSAVSGIKESASSLSQDAIVGISVAILVLLFAVQRFGTDRVGYTFAPIILLWFAFIGGIGLYNLFKYDVKILRALNPKYIVDYLKRNRKRGWISLGGVVLCITGTEAMFADLGHFNIRAIQIGFTTILLPSVSFAYIGQAAYLSKFPENVADTFYKSIPRIAVVTVMLITTCMVSLIMLVIWKTSIWWVVLFLVIFGGIEAMYISSALYKFAQGGFLPLAFSLVLMSIMGIWHYVHVEKYLFELKNKVPNDHIANLVLHRGLNKIPGIGLFYSELVQGVPPIFPHFIRNVPSIYSVLVFVSIKPLPISHVAMDERFLFRQVEPREYRMFRCVVRHGYNDTLGDPQQFERLLVEHLKEFVHGSFVAVQGGPSHQHHHAISSVVLHDGEDAEPRRSGRHATVHMEEALDHPDPVTRVPSASMQRGGNYEGSAANSSSRILAAPPIQGAEEEEKQFIQKAMEKGVVSLLGEAEVVSAKDSSLFKRIVVNHLYDFLRRNFRQGSEVMPVPHGRLLKVGMTYEI